MPSGYNHLSFQRGNPDPFLAVQRLVHIHPYVQTSDLW